MSKVNYTVCEECPSLINTEREQQLKLKYSGMTVHHRCSIHNSILEHIQGSIKLQRCEGCINEEKKVEGLKRVHKEYRKKLNCV